MAFNQFSNPSNQVKVGNATFTLPEGFHEGTITEEGYTNITNGYDTYIIRDNGADNTTKYVKQYVKNKQKDNITVHVKNFTVNDTVVYKASLTNHTNVAHYWFDYNGEVYSITTANANKNTNKFVTDVISSVN